MRVDPQIAGQRWCWLRRAGLGPGRLAGAGARARARAGARARARAGARAGVRAGAAARAVAARAAARRTGDARPAEVAGVAGVAPAVARKPPQSASASAASVRRPSDPRLPALLRAPLVFDDSSRASDVFPSEGDRDVSLQELLAYERKGHVCIRGVLSQDEARPMVSDLIRETKARQLDAYRHRISVLCPGVDADAVASEAEALDVLARGSEEEVGFLQTFNLHRPTRRAGASSANPASSSSDATPCARYILSRRLAKVAAELLGVEEDERVRLYQSCVFVKPPGFGETHWHSDANMVPLDTNRFITLWLPLRPLHEDDAALVFAGVAPRLFAPVLALARGHVGPLGTRVRGGVVRAARSGRSDGARGVVSALVPAATGGLSAEIRPVRVLLRRRRQAIGAIGVQAGTARRGRVELRRLAQRRRRGGARETPGAPRGVSVRTRRRTRECDDEATDERVRGRGDGRASASSRSGV